MLLGFIVAMGIFLMVAMPNVKTEIQREQEAELIFRGEAIARAIRAYKAVTGNYPITLEDLTKVRPRIIRKLYLDPMTGENGHEGEWDLITAVSPGASGDKTGLPIVGVRSYCEKDSIKTYHDKTLISDWTFSAADNLLGIPGGDAAAAAIGAAGVGIPGVAAAPKAAEGVDPSNLPQGVQAPPSAKPGNPPAQPIQPQTPPPGQAPSSPPVDQGATDSSSGAPVQGQGGGTTGQGAAGSSETGSGPVTVQPPANQGLGPATAPAPGTTSN